MNMASRYYPVMKITACPSLSERQLELYLMNHLPAQIAGSIHDHSIVEVEDHLLLCPLCQGAAETHTLLITALRLEQKQTRGFTVGATSG